MANAETNTETKPTATSASCRTDGVTLQILGSGGPIADDERTSSAYLVWHQNRALALVDFGGGAFVRFGQSGATLEDLEVIALSHLHTDHSADLPALLKGAYFSSRNRSLPVVGPSGSPAEDGPFPSLDDFLQGLFGSEHGVYRYLSGLLDGSDGLFALDARTLDATPGQPHTIELGDEALQLTALGVHHGIVPALAYRLQVDGRSLVFAGDQSAENPAMVDFARDADVLVAHVAIPPDAGRIARRLHRTPASWGKLAATAAVKQLVLSHWMQRSLNKKTASLEAVQKKFHGSLHTAADLDCIVL